MVDVNPGRVGVVDDDDLKAQRAEALMAELLEQTGLLALLLELDEAGFSPGAQKHSVGPASGRARVDFEE